jgi:hypothetical protein
MVPGTMFRHSCSYLHKSNHKKESIMEVRVEKGQVREDSVTSAIEKLTSRAPSSLFLGLALASMAVSATLKLFGKTHGALFVGQWAAPFLIMGNYNKMVKQHGSDATSRHPEAA